MELVKGTIDDLRVFYDRHQGRLCVPFSAFKEALNEWGIWCLVDGRKVAVILEKDGSAHVSGYHKERVGTCKMKWAIDQLKITKTSVGNFRQGHLLARRLGFKPDHVENEVIHYVLPH